MRRRNWTPIFLVTAAPLFCALSADTTAFAQAPAAAEPSEKDVQAATFNFKKGLDLFNMKKFTPALEAFKTSYSKVASPNSHLYVARCLQNLGKLSEAYFEFEKTVAEATERAKTEEKYGPTRDTAQTELNELIAKIALVTVNVTSDSPDAKLSIGGQDVPKERWGKPFPVAPGAVEAIVTVPSKEPAKESLTLKAGDKREIALGPTGSSAAGSAGGGGGDSLGLGGDAGGDTGGPEKKSGGNRKLLPFAIAAGGLGVIGFGVFAVAGSMSTSTYSDLEQKCGTGPCPPEFANDVSKGRTQQTIANVGLIVGAVGVAAAVPLFIFSLTGKKPADESGSSTSLIVGPGFTGVRGQF